MSARIQVIGDEVWADGYRVATLVTDGVPATVSGAFRFGLIENASFHYASTYRALGTNRPDRGR